jgi:hypothetical protein
VDDLFLPYYYYVLILNFLSLSLFWNKIMQNKMAIQTFWCMHVRIDTLNFIILTGVDE